MIHRQCKLSKAGVSQMGRMVRVKADYVGTPKGYALMVLNALRAFKAPRLP